MLEPRSSFVDVDDVRLHYLEWDPINLRVNTSTATSASLSASPQEILPVQANEEAVGLDNNDAIPVVLLHGLGATADTWRLVATQLYRQHLVVAFDQRGHGLSDQPENGYDLVTIVEDIICGMAKLGLGQVALVGHGWGARVALLLAARHPALISHLILVDCPHVEPKHWPGMTRERFIREQMPASMYASMASYLQGWQDELGESLTPEVKSIIMTYVRESARGGLEERLRAAHQRQIRESLWEDHALSYYAKLRCPVLLVPAAAQPGPGEEPPEHLEMANEFAAAKGQMAAQVARAIQHCSVLWMPDTAHDIQLQRPAELAKAIAHFLQQ